MREPEERKVRGLRSPAFGLEFEMRSRGSHYTFKKGLNLIMVVRPHGGRKFTAMADVKKIIEYLKEEGHV